MLSMQNSPTFILPPSSDLESNPSHGYLSHPQPTDCRSSLADPPAFPDYSRMDDQLSQRASVSTDDSSNDSAESWDADGPSDNSPPGESGVKVPTTQVGPSHVLQFNILASPEPDVVPKVEELEDHGDLQGIKPLGVETPTPSGPHATATDSSAAPVNVPRKRGRPRKHPLPVPGGHVKITKGRSKTGCITCRRRKKKCDETKPACLNCQKNAVVCEGYPPKEIWKSGKQKLEDARTQTVVYRALPILIDGIETEMDRKLLDHFVYGFSRVLTLINDDSNPFKEILLPMATQHRGLMHSLMCLSGSHLSGLSPEPGVKERKYYHFHRAIRDLKANITARNMAEEQEPELLSEDPIIASTIALSLNTICEGETNGEYRPHMDAARYLLVTQKPRNENFRQFIVEFFQYHDVSNSITSLDRRPAHLDGELRLPDFVPHAQAGMFLGVFDGLFRYISQVTRLRDRIRQRSNEGYEPAVDYQILSDAVMIDSSIRTWETSHPPNTPNYYLAQLYRQSTWVYLYRTIRPSRPSDKIAQVVDDGLEFLDLLPQDAGAFSIVLMPLFLLGCSAFAPRQREKIQKGFEALKAYSNLRNIAPAFEVVQRVWKVMDTKTEDSWDWERIIKEMNMDFLIT
ncbi:fungal-specific transcription factor domain-containing protein [Aspergillus aurantiobrunneus]